MRIHSPLDDVAIERDLASGAWLIEIAGERSRVREWSWGERKRLLEASLREGALDVRAFCEGFAQLLFDPPPSAAVRALAVLAALSASGASDSRGLPAFGQAEVVLARAFGWTPSVLDAEPAAGLDRLLLQLRAAADVSAPAVSAVAEQTDDGWTQIVVSDD